MARASIITAPITTPDGDKPLGDALLDVLASGSLVVDACAACGISDRTFYGWIEKGNELIDEPPTGDDGEPRELTGDERAYVHFAQAATRARAQAKVLHVENLRRGAVGQDAEYVTTTDGKIVHDRRGRPIVKRPGTAPDWRASAFYLERTDPANWGRRVAIDVDPDDRTPEPLYAATAHEAEAAFRAAHVPDGMIEDVLPALPAIDGTGTDVTDREAAAA